MRNCHTHQGQWKSRRELATPPGMADLQHNERTDVREVSRSSRKMQGHLSIGGGRQSDDAKLVLSMIEQDNPAFTRVLIEIARLRRYEVKLTEEVLANVIDTCGGNVDSEASRKYPDPLGGPKLVANSAGKVEMREPVVYYMRVGNRVKIGTTTNLPQRMKTLNPEELMAVEPGGHSLERGRHREFAHLHTHGEWFTLDDQLRRHIDAILRADAGRG